MGGFRWLFHLAVVSVLLLLHIHGGQSSLSQNQACHPTDLKALLDLFNALELPDAAGLVGWGPDSSAACCSWTGVACALGRVVGLDLSSRSLHGGISSSVASLADLDALDLSRNSLRGAVPQALARLPRLRVLDLSANALSGPFPDGGGFPALEELNISSNAFIGPHPVFPAAAASLAVLDISGNGFSGAVNSSALCPAVSGSAPPLQVLRFSRNAFSGELPGGLSRCEALVELSLDGNSLTGSIPGDLYTLPKLRRLSLQENQLAGGLSDGLGNLSQIVQLDLSNNRFRGSIPDVFSDLRWLQSVNLASNRFEGELPTSLSSCRQLRVISLPNNSLSGEIAAISFDLLTKLTIFDCGTNNLSGAIPPGIAACTKLRTLNLARNRLVGGVPESFKDLRSLSYLSLTGNGLTNLSSALQVLQHVPNLTSLVLTRNFRGGEAMPVGAGIDGFTMLQVLVLGDCLLMGVIPPWLQSLQSLSVLDISWNKLNGNIPPWIGKLNSLFYIDLSNNSLTGELPMSLTQMRSLQVSISTNDGSSGQSPADDDLPLFIDKNSSGTGLQYNHVSSFPPSIILSNNMLAGPILSSFGHLVKLHVLDLSWNSFSGTIPDELSNMWSLEVLNLAHNNLDGTIPSSLTNLNFLSKFDVSYNNLNGVIPIGGQFSTFTADDFEFNSELCISRNGACPERDASVEAMDDDTDTEMLTTHTTAAVGFVLGLLTISTAMLFARGWRAAYFLMVDRFFGALYVFTMVNVNRITRKNGE